MLPRSKNRQPRFNVSFVVPLLVLSLGNGLSEFVSWIRLYFMTWDFLVEVEVVVEEDLEEDVVVVGEEEEVVVVDGMIKDHPTQ